MKPAATPHAPLERRTDRTDRVWAWGAGALTTIVAAALSVVVFGRIPHVQDSIAQLFQARIFAGGRLWAPAPPLPEFFAAAHMIVENGRWFSQYPPGHALLLVPGVALGVPWLVNPVLGGLAVVGIYFLARELFDRACARVSSVLAVLSPFLLLMSAEFMSHAGSLCALTFYLLGYARALRTRRTRDGIWAGAALALAVLIRPYSALGVALPTVLHAAWRLRAEGRALTRPLRWVALGGAAGVGLLLLYNWGTTGSPLRFGYTALYGPSHGLGFGRGSWGPPHTLARGLAAAAQTIGGLNGRLFEWPFSSLWPAVLGLLLPTHRYPAWRRWGLAGVAFSLLAVYVFYWYHDACFGPRFLYEALGPILILSAIGLIAGSRWVATRLLPHRGGRDATWIGVLVVAICLAAGAVTRWPRLFAEPPGIAGLPPESPVRQGSYFQHFGRAYWGVSPYLGELAEARIHEPAIVFVHFVEPQADHVLPLRHLSFGSAFARQSPYLDRARILYAHDRGARNAELMARFPQRAAYLYRGGLHSGTLEELPRPGGAR